MSLANQCKDTTERNVSQQIDDARRQIVDDLLAAVNISFVLNSLTYIIVNNYLTTIDYRAFINDVLQNEGFTSISINLMNNNTIICTVTWK